MGDLLRADTGQVPTLIRDIGARRRWIDPELRRIVEDSSDNSKAKLHASLALLQSDPTQLDYLGSRLRVASPTDIPVLLQILRPYRERLVPNLWQTLEAAKPGDATLLPTAAVLADYDLRNSRWDDFADSVAHALVEVDPAEFGSWLSVLRPSLPALSVPLSHIVQDVDRPEAERNLASNVLAGYGRGELDFLAGLLVAPTPRPIGATTPSLRNTPRKLRRDSGPSSRRSRRIAPGTIRLQLPGGKNPTRPSSGKSNRQTACWIGRTGWHSARRCPSTRS